MDRYGKPWEIIFVNDGSGDGSAEVLDGLAEKNPEVKVIHFRRNFGQTAAMMAGFDFATGETIIPIDGDGQNDPEDIPRMLAKLDEGYEVCSGWRKDRQDNAMQRNFPSIMANKLISLVSGVELHDFGSSTSSLAAQVRTWEELTEWPQSSSTILVTLRVARVLWLESVGSGLGGHHNVHRAGRGGRQSVPEPWPR